MNCDMCGKSGDIHVALVEGTELNVCDNCARFGKILRKVEIEEQHKKYYKDYWILSLWKEENIKYYKNNKINNNINNET